MAPKNVILAALLALAVSAYGQTRSLLVNPSGVVQYTNTVEWQGALSFGTNATAQAVTRSNLSLGLPALTNTTGAGLLSALGGLATNGDAAGLTNFPSNLMTTNGDASGLTNFPSSLLTTNGDGSGLTNLPNANLTNATGVLPISNGGTGQTNAEAAIESLLPAYTNNEGKVLGLDTNLALVWTTNVGGGSGSVTNVDASGGSTGLTFSGGPITNGGTLTLGGTLNLISGGTGGTNASEARTALELGTAATNDATAFQPASTNLDTLASNNAINLTNFPAGLATYPSLSNNAGLVLAVATNETGVEWIAVSNTVTDASTLTNFPADLLRTNGDAAGLSNFPTFNQNTTGTASNVTGIVEITNGGTGTNSAAGARVNLLPGYTGNSNKVLAVNAGETDVEWVAQSGGGGLTSPVAVVDGGTGATNSSAALVNLLPSYTGNSNKFLALNPTETDVLWTNLTATVDLASTNATGTLPTSKGGFGNAMNNSTAQFYGFYNIGVYSSQNTSTHGIKLGYSAETTNEAVAIGPDAEANSAGSIAIGGNALASITGFDHVAIGKSARTTADEAIAIGVGARASAQRAVQIGSIGVNNTNSTPNSIQFMNAGSVSTNQWAALANAGIVGTNLLRSTNVEGAQAAIFPATTTNAPTNTNAPTPDAWLDVTVGTNAYKLPLWQ